MDQFAGVSANAFLLRNSSGGADAAMALSVVVYEEQHSIPQDKNVNIDISHDLAALPPFCITTKAARALAEELIRNADEIDGWAAKIITTKADE